MFKQGGGGGGGGGGRRELKYLSHLNKRSDQTGQCCLFCFENRILGNYNGN